jgi:hypothetical protein
MNPLVFNMNGDNFRSRNRSYLRRVWSNDATNKKYPITPFRAVMNAGDLLSRQNYTCGGSNQLSNASKRQGAAVFRGGIFSLCDGSDVPAANCNTKFVYDSSDYITYQKHRAIQKLYNDSSFGGANNGAVSALRHVRS